MLPLGVYRLVVNLRLNVPCITPQPPRWQLQLNRLMKIYLYGLMILMPLLGWFFLNAEGDAVKLFFIPLPSIAPISELLASLTEEVHELIGASGYLFIALHALDTTLRRMLLWVSVGT